MSLTSNLRCRSLFRRAFAGGAAALLVPLFLLSALLGAGSCSGDVVCVFATGCQGGGGIGDAGNAATLPEDAQWIKDGPPSIVDVFPTRGNTAASTTPVIVTFSESMNPDTVFGAIELIPVIAGTPGSPLPGVTMALIGEGRVLVLLPPTLQPVDEYQVKLGETAAATDLTGQDLSDKPGTVLDSFVVEEEDAEEPAIVTIWPAGGATRQGETGEVIVVFDRVVDTGTVDGDSFDVLVDGSQPSEDPEPEALAIDLGGFPLTDSRIYRWRSVDANGIPASLGVETPVQVKVSPAGNEILDLDGDAVPDTSIAFTTNELGAPLSSNLLSNPTDAMGLANLTAGDPEELLIQVDLLNAEEGDKLDLFLFGMNTELEPQLVALLRTITLAGTAPILTANFTLADVDILRAVDPITPRFADGAVAFAFRLRRGTNLTPLRVIDVDPVFSGVQDVILDTVAPTIDELLNTGGVTTFFRSDLRDIVLTGKASELLRAVEVTTALGTTDTLAPVVGSTESGYFVAAPVTAGILTTGTTTYSAVGYDAALNASTPVTGTFTQLGAVGPGSFVGGVPVQVQVFDSTTMALLEGALVMTHGDDGDGVGYPFVAAGTTDANGAVTLASAPTGETILSVDVPGYDLFTFHGLRSARLSVPLVPVGNQPTALVGGAARSDDDLASITLTLAKSKVSDSRRGDNMYRFYPGETCFNDPFAGNLACPYGPEPIFANRLGAQGWMAGSFAQATFNPVTLITAFDFVLPTPPTAAGEADVTEVWIPYVFVDPEAPANEIPLAIDPVALVGATTTGIDLDDLEDDPLTTGVPWITVETVSPGIPGAIPVGIGISFDQGGDVWIVNAAYPGAVGENGYFGLHGIVDTDLFLRAEIRDHDGNRSGQRPRISNLPDLPFADTLVPPGVPQISSPAAGGNTGGASYNIVFEDTVPDLFGEEVLYRVNLVDSVGRRWTIWRPDAPDAAGPEVIVRVPDLTQGGGTMLFDGAIAASVSLFGWPDLALDEFLWSDVPREYDLFAHSAPVTFTQP